MDSISSIKGVSSELSSIPIESMSLTSTKNNQPVSFSSMIGNTLNVVNDNISSAEHATKVYALDGSIPTHELMLHLEKAKFSLHIAVEVRNRLVEAYSELTRMQI